MQGSQSVDPHSLDAEIACLGAALHDQGALSALKLSLAPEDFYADKHRIVFSAMLDLSESGTTCDLVTLGGRIRELKKVTAIGGLSYLSELADSVGTAANVDHYIKIVRDKATLRKLATDARNIIEQTRQIGADPSQIPTRLSINTNHPAEIARVSTTIRALNKNIEAGYPGLFPCYDLLARTIRKIVPGHFWVIAGYTSTGKSAFLVDLICRLYAHGIENPGVAVFSTEMSCEQYLLRMLSNRTAVPSWKITEKRMTPDEIFEVTKAQGVIASRNLYLYDRHYKIDEIEATARMIKDTARLDVIAIDYLQNIWGEGKIYDRMSRLAPILQYLAKDIQVTVIALSQVSNEHVREKAGGVYGYKGAGEIAASADLGIELRRDRGSEMMEFRVEKNRHGRLGEGALEYVAGYTRLHEIPQEDKE